MINYFFMGDIDSLSADVRACVLAGQPSVDCDQVMNTACETGGSLFGSQYCACINSIDACPFSTTQTCRNAYAYATSDMVNFSGKYGECKNYCSINTTVEGSNINAQITQSCGPVESTNYYIIFIGVVIALIAILFFRRVPTIIPPPSVYGPGGIATDYVIKI